MQSLLAVSGIITRLKAWESLGAEVSIMIQSSRAPSALWLRKDQYSKLTLALRPAHNTK